MFQNEELMTARLRAPFLPDEHEFHERFGLIFLKEKAISDRLTRVLGNKGWGFELIGQPQIWGDPANKENPASVTQQARLILRLPSRNPSVEGFNVTAYDNVGGDVLLALGKTPNEKLMNTIKGATTDAFKRAARSAGVGLYLSEMSKYKGVAITIENMGSTFLPDFGYIPTIKAAKTKFLTATGYDPSMEEAKLKERVVWFKSHGYDDYDFQTILPFIIEVWNKEHE